MRTLALASLLLVTRLSPAENGQFPLRIGPTSRYLVDQAGNPFLLHGDSPWSLIVAVTKEDADLYFADRRAKGVNTIIVNLIEHKFNGPVNRYGEGPFRTPGDFATPNEAYFAHADWVLRRAAENGMVVLLTPMYLGYRGLDEGWYQEALLNGSFKCHEYGKWVGERYKSYKNIIWVIGGDRRADQAREAVDALARGLHESNPDALFTAHAEPGVSAMEEYAIAGLDINSTYTYDIVHKKVLQDYSRRPVMPFFLFETSYEGEHEASEVQIRRQAYWALLSGAMGQCYGNRPLWLFDPGWKDALNSPGARDMARVRKLFNALPWYEFEPDTAHRVVTSGLGEENGMDRLTAARTRDRSLMAAYMPARREIEVDLGQLQRGRFSGWWYDPRSGMSIPVAEKLDSGRVRLIPPSEGDWALVIQSGEKSGRVP